MRYRVQTPENVTFEFELAGVASRAFAWLIDLVVMGVVIAFAGQVISALAGRLGGVAMAILFVVVFVMQWWYGALLEWGWAGRTVGKRVLGLRVLSADGLPLTFLQAVIRNLVRIVDLLPGVYLVGGLCALIDIDGRRLGDLAAQTIVVRERSAARPSTVVPASERYNSFVDDPHVAVALRRITAPERDAMVGLSLRREELPVTIRRELFGQLATHLETRLGVPRPAHFSEEKFVLNLTAVALDRPQVETSR